MLARKGRECLPTPMKIVTTILTAVVLTLSFSSCASYKSKYEKNAAGSTAFLEENKTDKARINVEGLYYSPEWKGLVAINQESGGKLDGLFPRNDKIKGIVSGNKVYLALYDGNWTFYTTKLKRDAEGNLVGFFTPGAPFSEKDQHPMILKKITP